MRDELRYMQSVCDAVLVWMETLWENELSMRWHVGPDSDRGLRPGPSPNEGDGVSNCWLSESDQHLLQRRIVLLRGELSTWRNISPTCCEILLKPLLLFLDYEGCVCLQDLSWCGSTRGQPEVSGGILCPGTQWRGIKRTQYQWHHNPPHSTICFPCSVTSTRETMGYTLDCLRDHL